MSNYVYANLICVATPYTCTKTNFDRLRQQQPVPWEKSLLYVGGKMEAAASATRYYFLTFKRFETAPSRRALYVGVEVCHF